MKLAQLSGEATRKLQVKLVLASGEIVKLQAKLKVSSLQSYEELQAKLTRKDSDETNILALQQGYRASSEDILLGHA